MCDIVDRLNAYPIKIKSAFKELETKAIRVYPDNQDLAEHILDLASQPKPVLNKKRFETHELTHKHYDWNNTFKKWEKYLDSLDSSGYRSNWNTGEYLEPLNTQINNPSNSNFDNLLHILNNNMKNASMIGDQKMLELLNSSDYGFVQNGPTSILGYGFQDLKEYIKTNIDNNNQAKQAKDSNITFDEDFILYAKLKNKQQ